MYFIVAFSSSLDVAAIQMELGRSLDFNHELITVGWSNVISGALGGFTGSYIFSQTIFTMRAGITTRLCGFTVVLSELAIFALPFSVLAYIPRLFFGGILLFICFDLLLDWLWHSRHQVHRGEFVIVWITFLSINLTNLEIGMGIGIVVSCIGSLPLYSILSNIDPL